MAWKKFDQRRSRRITGATVTIAKDGAIVLSASASSLLPADAPEYVEFLWDDTAKRIAVRPVEGPGESAYKVTLMSGRRNRKIFAGSFLRALGMLPEKSTRDPASWNSKNKFLVIDLASPVDAKGSDETALDTPDVEASTNGAERP